jgi:hypothetical protein
MIFLKDANIRIDVPSLKQLVGKKKWFSKKLEKIILSDAGRLLKIYKFSFTLENG